MKTSPRRCDVNRAEGSVGERLESVPNPTLSRGWKMVDLRPCEGVHRPGESPTPRRTLLRVPLVGHLGRPRNERVPLCDIVAVVSRRRKHHPQTYELIPTLLRSAHALERRPLRAQTLWSPRHIITPHAVGCYVSALYWKQP